MRSLVEKGELNFMRLKSLTTARVGIVFALCLLVSPAPAEAASWHYYNGPYASRSKCDIAAETLPNNLWIGQCRNDAQGRFWLYVWY